MKGRKGFLVLFYVIAVMLGLNAQIYADIDGAWSITIVLSIIKYIVILGGFALLFVNDDDYVQYLHKNIRLAALFASTVTGIAIITIVFAFTYFGFVFSVLIVIAMMPMVATIQLDYRLAKLYRKEKA
jgi:hypothetical protein